MTQPTIRFAPSPTGYLHLGHAYSALLAYKTAQDLKGRFLLRIEDIDQGRCRPEFEQAIYEDLAWLGLEWEAPVRRQSAHFDDYATAVSKLKSAGLLYPCFCTRKEILREIALSPSAPHGPDGPHYPGICKELNTTEVEARIAQGQAYALRLDSSRAFNLFAIKGQEQFEYADQARGRFPVCAQTIGDVVLARKDTPTSYHLSVVLDDHLQGVTHIIRGEDLLAATGVHRVLQALLGLNIPEYRHHRLVRDAGGKRLAKRRRSPTIRDLRASGQPSAELRDRIISDPESLL